MTEITGSSQFPPVIGLFSGIAQSGRLMSLDRQAEIALKLGCK
jgi:hypothetical protein